MLGQDDIFFEQAGDSRLAIRTYCGSCLCGLLRRFLCERSTHTLMLVERFAHSRDVMWCCATTAAYQANPGFVEAYGIICEVIGRCHVEKPVVHASWQSCSRLC